MSEGSKIQWGTIIAGAAIVAGIALAAPTVVTAVGALATQAIAGVGSAGSGIFAAISSAFSATPAAGGAWAKLTEFLGTYGAQLTGAGLIGGGAAYLLSDKGGNENYAVPAEARESFAEREDIRKMQGLMQARMAAVGMASGSMGRG